MPNYGWRKQSKYIFNYDRGFEFKEFEIYPSSRYRESTVMQKQHHTTNRTLNKSLKHSFSINK